MDINKLLNGDYLDILFYGKNKEYGSYELRKKYKKRATIAGAISMLVVGLLFFSTLIDLSKEDDVIVETKPVITEVKLADPPPIKENEPPPPPPPQAPPPVKSTVKFTVPEIKKDNEVPKEAKIEQPPKPEDNKVVGVTTQKGSDDPDALDPGLSNLPSGNGPAVPVTGGTGGNGTGGAPTEVFRTVEQMPKAPYDFSSYLAKNTKYPQAALEDEIQGKVYVEFIVETDGSIKNPKVVKGQELGGGLAQEAIRVVSAAPKWTPGKQNGQPVRVYYVVPVTFKLQ